MFPFLFPTCSSFLWSFSKLSLNFSSVTHPSANSLLREKTIHFSRYALVFFPFSYQVPFTPTSLSASLYWLTDSVHHTYKNSFPECWRWSVLPPLISLVMCSCKQDGAQRNEFPKKPRVRRAGNNSAAAPAGAASEGVAAVSVREMEKGECV